MTTNLKLREISGRNKKLKSDTEDSSPITEDSPQIKTHPKLLGGSKSKLQIFCTVCLSISIVVYIFKSKENCLVDNITDLTRTYRPLFTCEFCENVHMIKRIGNVTPEFFENNYAYSGEPVIITDATVNWTAHHVSTNI